MKKIYLPAFFAILILVSSATVSAQVNSVTLTPPTGPAVNYASITAAYTAIPSSPTGNYLIELLAPYNGTDVSESYPITLTDKGLLPGGFTITIRPVAGNISETIQRVTPAAGPVILFNGADNVILDGRPGGVVSASVNYLTVNDPFSGDNLSRAIELLNGANNNTITYINAVAAPGTSGTIGARVINISTSVTASNNNTISNNVISGGLRGVQVFGTVANNSGTLIINNTVRDFTAIGIFGGAFQDNTTIQSNTITFTTNPASTSITGIQNQGTTTNTNILDNIISVPLPTSTTVTSVAGIVNVGNGVVNVLRNTISNLSSGVATSIQGIAASPGTTAGTINISRNKIADLSSGGAGNIRGIAVFQFAGSVVNLNNNFVSITQPNTTASAIFGILFGVNGTTNPYTSNVYYNSVRIGGTHTGGTAGTIYAYGIFRGDNTAASVYNQKNNISVMDRSGGTSGIFLVAFFNSSAAGTLSIDYNTYFGTAGSAGNAYAGGWVANLYDNTQLAAYKTAATPHETNSNFTNVTFASNTDLHLSGASLTDANLNGTPIPGVTTDIDGLTRSATTPTRGGDESTVAVPSLLTSFIAYRSSRINILKWTTTQEINSRRFVVEKSNNGRDFDVIGEVLAAGNSQSNRDYRFTDSDPVKGMNYYRIKTVDLDNSGKYSEISSVRNTGDGLISVYPNPVVDVTKLVIDSENKDIATVVITDMKGTQLYLRNFAVAEGNNTLSLEMATFSKGIYVVQIKLSNSTFVQKISKL